MRGNTITMRLFRGMLNRSLPLYQYDYGQRLVFTGVDLPNAYEVHFSNTDRGDSKTAIGNADGVDIPDEFLLSGEQIRVWLFLHDGADDGETEYKGIIPVHTRARPTNAEPTPVQQDVITQTIAALNEAVEETETNVEHYPQIVEGYWWVWDAELGDWVSTGVKATGDKGDKGDKGDTGATPDFAIGTVETLPAGSSATATITGTAKNPVLNLGLPKGDPGELTEADVASTAETQSMINNYFGGGNV